MYIQRRQWQRQAAAEAAEVAEAAVEAAEAARQPTAVVEQQPASG